MTSCFPSQTARARRVLWVGIGAGLIGLISSQAEESPEPLFRETTFEELANITVTTVSRREERLFNSAAAVSVVTGAQIRQRGLTTIPEALRLSVGTAVAQVNSREWGVSVRGFNAQYANKLLVLIDGRSIYTPLFGGTYWSMQSQPMEEVAQLEVVRGPGGAVWGANAVNGVINIVTVPAQESLGARLTASVATDGWRGFARDARDLGAGWAARYYVEAKHLDETLSITGDKVRDAWRKTQTGFRADRIVEGQPHLTLQGDAFWGDGGLTQPYVNMTAPGLRSTDTATGLHVHGFNLRGRAQSHDAAGTGWFIQAWVDQARRTETLIDETRTTWDGEAQRNVSVGRHLLTAGLGFRTSQDDTQGFQHPAFEPAAATLNLASLLLQDEMALFDSKLHLTAGARLEHNSYTGWEFQPSLRLLWQASADQVFWAAVSRGVRNPTRFDRALRLDAAGLPAGTLGPGTPATLIRWYGNAGFDSETTVAYEAGWRSQLRQALALDLSGFVQNYQRGLEAVPSGTFLPEQSGGTGYLVWKWDLLNRRPATAYGGELSLVYDPTDRLRVTAGYSFVRVESGGAPGGVNSSAVETTTPRHTAYLDLQTNLGRGWEIGAGLRYFSRTAALPVPAVLAPELRLLWRPRPGLTLLLRGDNLADPSHPELDSRTGQPVSEIARRVFLQVSWEK